MTELISISEKEYKKISALVYSKFGIDLGDKKKSLVLGRLHKIVKQHKFSSFQQYLDYVVNDSSGNGLSTLIDRISTNHTFFYREKEHYDYFTECALPQVMDMPNVKKQKQIRIWSAGCSSGEEPCNLAMLIYEHIDSQISNWKIGILGTDISTKALKTAVKGIYSKENIEHLPQKLKVKYLRSRNNGHYIIDGKIKNLILYRRLNLMNSEFPFKNKFHIIFCRNVMIYFDRPTRENLVEKFHRHLVPNGYLFIGHSESLGRSNKHFQYLKPAVYINRG